MKKLTLTFLALLALAATQPSSFLTESESTAVVRDIDNICGDTWCEGDFNYSFDQLVCNSAECYFDIQLITRNESLNQSRPYRCQLQGFHAREDLISPSSSYTDKLYEAIGSCINDEIPQHLPVVYLPAGSSCLNSLRQKPSYKSAAHSIYAEVFYEMEDKALASAKVLTQMVEAYAAKDKSCSLQYFMAFKDEISCERMGMGAVCSVPTDSGRFIVIKDGVDGAAVIYIEKTAKKASLGTLQSGNVNVNVAQPESCYTELLNLDGKQKAQMPFNSSDHHTYFVSAKNLKPNQDPRKNSAQLINAAVTAVKCPFQLAVQSLESNVCKTLGGIDLCLVASKNAGYYIVTKDAADGAYVTFLRYD